MPLAMEDVCHIDIHCAATERDFVMRRDKFEQLQVALTVINGINCASRVLVYFLSRLWLS